jgi:FlgN protein
MNPMLEAELLAHLDHQISSARQLLRLVLAQGEAIRARDVERVLARLSEIQTEMGRRGRLEQERTRLLQAAGALIGVAAPHVTLERLCALITLEGARAARERSSELRGLLAEIAREHGINRALMRQELAFLSHLVRLVGAEPEAGYQPGGAPAGAPGSSAAPPPIHKTLDLKA